MSTEDQGTTVNSPASSDGKKSFLQWKNPFQRILDNPVILKELRGRMRNRQAFTLLTLYLGLIALFIVLIYSFIAQQTNSFGWDPAIRQTTGKAIFGTVVLMEILLLSFIAPGLTAGSITSERERQTFDLLRTTLITGRALILGKLGSAFTFLFLLILTALPIQGLAFLLGGVGLGEMVVASLMLIVTALFFCALGLYFSSYMKRTLSATLSSYAAILLSFLMLIVIFLLIAYMESASLSSGSSLEKTLSIILWMLISTNPLFAAIMTEVILVEDQSLFLTTNTPFANSGTLLSPWIIFVVVYLGLTTILVLLSIRNVNRPDK